MPVPHLNAVLANCDASPKFVAAPFLRTGCSVIFRTYLQGRDPMLRTVIVCSLIVGAPMAMADVLLLDGIEAERASASQRPPRGASMERVEAMFGEPTNREAPVGDPPIARWEYPGFVVYFENQYVIHAVPTH
jgi:hypothetical protein